ncbi:MAG: hypothetical protein LBR11_04775 [Deltaproteobacteria bacterium]|nr:hypothetical protein [Deltaproteobacteria bacterium]
MVELSYQDFPRQATKGKILEKNEVKPCLSKMWKIPPGPLAAFVRVMEKVLETYQKTYDPDCSVFCVAESPIQLVEERGPPINRSSGGPQFFAPEYIRRGEVNIFVAVEPLPGQRRWKITGSRAKFEWAFFVKELMLSRYKAEKLFL